MKSNYDIIIPHKNTPDLLQRCLNSIPERDDVHVIIVDDNSDPKIVDFDRFPGLNNKQVEVIFDKTEKGAGHARNIGIAKARAKWLIFADSDDYFSPLLDDKLNIYLDSEYDIIFFGIDSVYSDTLLPSNRRANYDRKYYKAIDTGNYDILRYKMNEPWAKIISLKLVIDNGVRFDEVPVSNDVMFALKLGYHANSIYADRDIVYITTQRVGSLTTIINKDKLWCRYNVALCVNQFLYENKKSKYHVNLFSYIQKSAKVNLFCALKIFLYSCLHTPMKYIFIDVYRCFLAVLSKVRS